MTSGLCSTTRRLISITASSAAAIEASWPTVRLARPPSAGAKFQPSGSGLGPACWALLPMRMVVSLLVAMWRGVRHNDRRSWWVLACSSASRPRQGTPLRGSLRSALSGRPVTGPLRFACSAIRVARCATCPVADGGQSGVVCLVAIHTSAGRPSVAVLRLCARPLVVSAGGSQPAQRRTA